MSYEHDRAAREQDATEEMIRMRTPEPRYVPRGETDVEVLQAMRRRIKELEKALGHYTHCRHACIDCNCTLEARGALNG